MATPIRVLELRCVRGTGGGPEKTILLGAARADRSHYKITVCYLRDGRDKTFCVDRRAADLPIDYQEVVERNSFDLRTWKAFRDIVRSSRTQIVHSHDYKTNFLALLLSHREHVIPISTAHGWSGHGWKERHVYYPADRRLLARFPRVIAVSTDIRDVLIAAGANVHRVAVVPNGIDHERFRRESHREADARSAFGLRPGDIAIGAVGRLETEKNYPLLINVFAKLAADFPRLRLLIAGDGSLRPALGRQIEDLGLEGRCLLLGQVPDVVLLHHALDHFVMSSANEGTPNAVLEAMALGTPVVATRVGGIPDLITDRREGLLVTPNDAEALQRALVESISDVVGRRARVDAARAKIEHELSFECRMARVEALYDELVADFHKASAVCC